MKFSAVGSTAALALLLTLGATTGCKDQLELSPQQSIDAGEALNSREGIESAVVGAYARLDLPQLYGTNMLLLPELLASENNINWQGTFVSYREVARKEMTSLNTEADRTFNQAYQTINLTNLILAAINPTAVTDEDDRAQFEGEAKFIRALVYFDLVRLYAQQYQAATAASQPGVPLSLTPNTSEEQAGQRLPRASVAAVYQQVIQDLQDAIAKLPEANGVRADVYDAQALLSRVYLQQANYTQARNLANEVIQNSGAALNASVLSAFTNRNTRESLFEIQQNDQNNAGAANDGLATFYSSNAAGFGGRGDVQILESFAGLYGVRDQRGSAQGIGNSLIYTGTGRRAGRLRSYKWNTAGQNIPIIRIAELYLTRAEANFRLGAAVGASPWADVNRIRARAQADSLNPVILKDANNVPIIDPTTNQPQKNPNARQITLAQILRERELELAFEGFRLHDYRRTQRDISTAIPWNSPRLVMPIPQHEINLGNALPQNPGY
ncbi:RagB/SusD family nutrient uptake outer membrane protein [Solirubrum puertoriconensis]|nr:RagB/SusD family nutrient uptake outer membrane protein [Solirubrum puertoriconensis]